MNAELKPGMMAMVIGSYACTKNIGRLVTLELFIKPNSSEFFVDGIFETEEEPMWVVSAEDIQRNTAGGIIISNLGAHVEKHLMPIKPQSDPLHTKEEQHASA